MLKTCTRTAKRFSKPMKKIKILRRKVFGHFMKKAYVITFTTWTPLILNIGSILVLYLVHSKTPIIWPSSKKNSENCLLRERRFFCCLEHVSHVKPPNLSPTLPRTTTTTL